MKRSGFTLVEVSVAMLIGVIALVVAFNAIILLTKGEKSTDRAANRALTDSRLMSALLQDVRSSTQINPQGTDTYEITRYYPNDATGVLEPKKVVWKVINDPLNPRVTRQVGTDRPDEFNYKGLLDDGANKQPGQLPVSDPSQGLAFKLKLEKVKTGVTFNP